MKKAYWIFLVLLVIAGLGASVYLGIQPRPIAKINYSQFNSDEQFSQALSQRLRVELQMAKVIFVGVQPEQAYQYSLWNTFFQTNNDPSTKFDYVIIDSNLPHKNLVATTEAIDLSLGKDPFLQGLKKILDSGKRVAFILANQASTTKSTDSIPSLIQNEFNYPGFSFTTSHFPRNADEERTRLPFPCGNSEDGKGATPLGCFIQTTARNAYRKKNEEGKMDGIVNQIGSKEYLVLVNPALR
ncbi:MAG: hypothetical protein V4736_13030 [Bdellovibrionota bacterium]